MKHTIIVLLFCCSAQLVQRTMAHEYDVEWSAADAERRNAFFRNFCQFSLDLTNQKIKQACELEKQKLRCEADDLQTTVEELKIQQNDTRNSELERMEKLINTMATIIEVQKANMEIKEENENLTKTSAECRGELFSASTELREKEVQIQNMKDEIKFIQQEKTRIAAELSEKSRQLDAAIRTSISTTTPTPTTTTSTTTTVRPTTWTPPPGAVIFSTGTYFFNRYLNWTSAREHCQSLGMDLVAIETREENEALANHARTVFGRWWTWTSGCYSRREDAVVWRSTGSKLTYANWWPQHDYGNLKNEERCVAIHTDDKDWGEMFINDTIPSICERI